MFILIGKKIPPLKKWGINYIGVLFTPPKKSARHKAVETHSKS